jgi:hypothetical protein
MQSKETAHLSCYIFNSHGIALYAMQTANIFFYLFNAQINKFGCIKSNETAYLS